MVNHESVIIMINTPTSTLESSIEQILFSIIRLPPVEPQTNYIFPGVKEFCLDLFFWER